MKELQPFAKWNKWTKEESDNRIFFKKLTTIYLPALIYAPMLPAIILIVFMGIFIGLVVLIIDRKDIT